MDSTQISDNQSSGEELTCDLFKTFKRLAKNKARLVFLLKCRRFAVFPRFIMDRTNKVLSYYTENSNECAQIGKVVSSLRLTMLNIEIGRCNFDIKSNESSINTIKFGLTAFGNINIDVLADSYELVKKETMQQQNKLLHKKFENLKRQQAFLPDISYDDSFIKNFTQVDIPHEMMVLLSLGPKFAIGPDVFPILDVATDIEYIVSRYATGHIQKGARGALIFELAKFAEKTNHNNRIQRFLKKAVKVTSEFLKCHAEIIVTNSDKGSVTIISYRNEYKEKVNVLLNDQQQFSIIRRDPTAQLQTRNNKIAASLVKSNFINKDEAKQITTYTAVPPRMFAQIKYHKEGLPIRPIVSTVNSPAYRMSRFLTNILNKSFKKPKYNIKNSFELIKKLRHKHIPNGNILVSFDVVNCFNNIPVDLVLEIISRDFHKISKTTRIPKENFIEMLKFCLIDANYFLVNECYYRQNEGLFMGCSLSSKCVERVIEDVVDKTIEAMGWNPLLWTIYVDDHLAIIPDGKENLILDKLNSYHPNIKFTLEREIDSSINFLDVTISHKEDKIFTNWYHKPIASNRLINFYSAHPKHMIRNTAISFASRVFQLSHRQFNNINTSRILDILKKNNFPEKYAKIIINQALNKSDSRNHTINSSSHFNQINNTSTNGMDITSETTIANNHNKYASVTYIPGVTEKLKKKIEYFVPDVKIAEKPPHKVRSLFSKLKDKLPITDTSGCVYRLNCNDCEKCYIGETIQKLKSRIQQHKNSCSDLNLNKNNAKTALAEHTKEHHHNFDFSQPKILKKEKCKNKLRIQEANHIIISENVACNFKTDIEGIGPVYYNLIRNHNHTSNHTTRLN